jgi:Domain of unknown function (DUF4145)
MDQEKDGLLSYCRRCGGERHHSVVAEKTRHWGEDDSPVEGSDTWSILECRACLTITVVNTHWFSEDCDLDDDGWTPIVHRDLYPPAPSRKMPEWGVDALLCLPSDHRWIVQLHADIYAALGMKSYSLAAMGTRAIVDFIVTTKAGDKGYFGGKLNRMREQNLITEIQVGVIFAAFDAGSAAVHRGHSPTREDVNTQIDIAETLLQQIYIDPVRQKRQAEAAAALKSRTPQRPNRRDAV